MQRQLTSTLDREWVPQPPELAKLFNDLPTAPAVPAAGGLLVCRVTIGHSTDPFGLPDPGAVLRFDRDIFYFQGKGDRYFDYFSLPDLGLSKGAKIDAELLDFDLMRHDYLGVFSLDFDGKVPFRLDHERKHQLACRQLDAAGVAARLDKEVTATKRAIAAVRIGTPNLQQPSLGFASTQIPKAWESLDRVAAWTGWDEPATNALSAQLQKLQATWSSKAAAYLSKQLASLPEPGKARARGKTFEAWDAQVLCDGDGSSAARPCAVVLQASTSKPQFGQTVSAFDSQGYETELGSADVKRLAEDKPASQPGWVRVTWTLRAPPLALGKHPGRPPYNIGGPVHLLRLCPKQRGCLLRLR